MKKLITLTFALLFSAGMAFGQVTADIDQDGNGNDADIVQDILEDSNEPTTASIDQDGNGNDAYIEQIAGPFTGIYSSETIQDGNGNVASQVTHTGNDVILFIEQIGNGNTAIQDSRGGADNTLKAWQTGNGNYSRQLIDGSVHTALVDQNGNGNTAVQELTDDVSFTGANLGDLHIFQDGNGNEAYQFVQTVDKYDLLIDQRGNGNWARMDITLEGIVANIWQTGNGNTASVTSAETVIQ